MVFTIVEGCGASTPREFARFLDMEIKSNKELESQLELARDYGLITTQQWEPLAESVVRIRKMSFTFRKKVLEENNPKPLSQQPPAPDPSQPRTQNPNP